MRYTIAEFKQNTRKILNEALESPVTITRYDEEFILTSAAQAVPSTTINGIPVAVKPEAPEGKLFMVNESDIKTRPAKLKPLNNDKLIDMSFCKEHHMEKEYCKGFKHRSKS
jgi:hypothetical protein